MMKYIFKASAMTALLTFLVLENGCNSDITLTQAIPMGIQLTQTTTAQCPNGGELIRTFRDQNADGIFEAGEKIVSEVPICNGNNGAPGAQGPSGYGEGIQVTPANPASCPAGGLALTTYVDLNNDGLLDFAEPLTSISTVCNGTNGSNGSNGASVHLTVAPATQTQCAAGGVDYTSSTDGENSDQTVVCNGANGTNGTNGSNATFETGAVGPTVAGKPYSACHHDYVYLPGSASAKGWLIFRHQENGAADQGIGSTGFQVWNVDISDFLLASEVGNVTYCRLHWDPGTQILNYSVIDSTDGLSGLNGTIHL